MMILLFLVCFLNNVIISATCIGSILDTSCRFGKTGLQILTQNQKYPRASFFSFNHHRLHRLRCLRGGDIRKSTSSSPSSSYDDDDDDRDEQYKDDDEEQEDMDTIHNDDLQSPSPSSLWTAQSEANHIIQSFEKQLKQIRMEMEKEASQALDDILKESNRQRQVQQGDQDDKDDEDEEEEVKSLVDDNHNDDNDNNASTTLIQTIKTQQHDDGDNNNNNVKNVVFDKEDAVIDTIHNASKNDADLVEEEVLQKSTMTIMQEKQNVLQGDETKSIQETSSMNNINTDIRKEDKTNREDSHDKNDITTTIVSPSIIKETVMKEEEDETMIIHQEMEDKILTAVLGDDSTSKSKSTSKKKTKTKNIIPKKKKNTIKKKKKKEPVEVEMDLKTIEKEFFMTSSSADDEGNNKGIEKDTIPVEETGLQTIYEDESTSADLMILIRENILQLLVTLVLVVITHMICRFIAYKLHLLHVFV